MRPFMYSAIALVLLASSCGKDPSPGGQAPATAPTTSPTTTPATSAPPGEQPPPTATTDDTAAAPAANDAQVAATTAPDVAAEPEVAVAPPPPPLAEPDGAPRSIKLKIMSATVRQKAIEGATVTLQRPGFIPVSAPTDKNGKVDLTSRFGVDDESVTLVVRKDGYSPLFVECPCDGLSYALSETLGQDKPEAIRIVINWGTLEPSYIDLHLVFPNNHVYWNGRQQGEDAALDVRANDAFGPATATIHKRHADKQYVLAAHRWGATGFGDKLLGLSKAKIFVYIGNTLVRTYKVPEKKVGALWVVFAIDGDGAFHDINNVVDMPKVESIQPYLRQITERTSFGTPTRPSSKVIAQADELRKSGLAALAEGKHETAFLGLQKALSLYPTSLDLYEDLARVFDALGASAEAQWSRRIGAKLAALPPAQGFRIPNDLIEVAASSNLPVWKHYTFTADNLLDDNLWSSWQPLRKPAGGVGEWFKLSFKTPVEISGFEVNNGFRLIDELGDLYLMNNRVKEGELELSDGTVQTVTFEDTSAEKTIMLDAPKTVTWVKFKVKSIYKGTKWNDLAMSEFHPLGKVE